MRRMQSAVSLLLLCAGAQAIPAYHVREAVLADWTPLSDRTEGQNRLGQSATWTLDDGGRITYPAVAWPGHSPYLTLLPGPGPDPQSRLLGMADDINDQGDVVGWCSPPPQLGGPTVRASLWHAGTFHWLSLPDGVTDRLPFPSETVAVSVNESRWAAGHAIWYDATGTLHESASVWKPDGGGFLLDQSVLDPGWQLTDVFQINERGMLWGNGSHYGSNSNFIAVPEIPEPPCLTLCALGLTPCLVARRTPRARTNTNP